MSDKPADQTTTTRHEELVALRVAATHQLVVLHVILTETNTPYTDYLKRRSRLSDKDFDAAVRKLIAVGILERYSAPLGEILYPALVPVCEICSDPLACLQGKQSCELSGQIYIPSADIWIDPSVFIDPCIGFSALATSYHE